MNTKETCDLPDAAVDAQTVAACIAAGKPIPPDVVLRVRERGKAATKAILERHGIQNIGVDIIRELRGDLPKP